MEREEEGVGAYLFSEGWSLGSAIHNMNLYGIRGFIWLLCKKGNFFFWKHQIFDN